MKEEEILQITDTVKSEMERWFLEQKIINLENSSSDMLAYFSNLATVAGVFIAIALFIAGWIMKMVIDDRLESVKDYTDSTSEKFNDVKEVERKLESKFDSIEEIDRHFKKSKEDWEKIKEINVFLTKEINYLKHQVETERTITRLSHLSNKVEKKLEEINDDDIKAYDWGDGSENPLDEFEWQKEPLLEAIESLDFYNDHNYKFVDYLSDVEANEGGHRLEELQDKLKYLEEYHEFLLKFK